jgi:hypothetical protein
LAAHFRCTVEELQNRMSYVEFCQWIVFMAVEPIGDRRMDLHFAMLETLLANMNRDLKQRFKAYEIKDFLVDFWDDRPKPSLRDKFMSIAGAINAQNGAS